MGANQGRERLGAASEEGKRVKEEGGQRRGRRRRVPFTSKQGS